MSKSVPKYRIAHIGLNHPDEAQALDTVRALCAVFDLEPDHETNTHVFAGDLFEVKKNMTRGKYGHVAMQTDDIELALDHLAQKGISFREETIRRNEFGKIEFVYLNLEIAGFWFHLTL